MGTRVNRYSQTTRDANEPELVKVAQQIGAKWHQGPPLDGWILFRGVWMPVEIKLPEREGTANEYTPAQHRFIRFAKEHHGPYWTWRTVDDVIASLNCRRTA